MHRSAFVAAASILIANALAHAGETADVVFPEGWFSLDAGEAGIIFLLRNHGPDLSFEVLDETGRTVDVVVLPEGRTVLPQYRVAAGRYRVQLLGQEATLKAQPGQFATYGVAVTWLPATGDKPQAMLPMHAPSSTSTVTAMEQRIASFVAMGTTDLLPPKALSATALEFRLTGESSQPRQ
jgi:hypothetical protein